MSLICMKNMYETISVAKTSMLAVLYVVKLSSTDVAGKTLFIQW